MMLGLEGFKRGGLFGGTLARTPTQAMRGSADPVASTKSERRRSSCSGPHTRSGRTRAGGRAARGHSRGCRCRRSSRPACRRHRRRGPDLDPRRSPSRYCHLDQVVATGALPHHGTLRVQRRQHGRVTAATANGPVAGASRAQPQADPSSLAIPLRTPKLTRRCECRRDDRINGRHRRHHSHRNKNAHLQSATLHSPHPRYRTRKKTTRSKRERSQKRHKAMRLPSARPNHSLQLLERCQF